MGFLQNIGLQMGYNQIYGVEQATKQADLQLKQEQIKQGQMQLMQQAQIMESREAIAKEQQAQDAITGGKIQSPMAVASQYDAFSRQALQSGDYQGAQQYATLATNARTQAKDAQTYAEKEQQNINETAAKAALTLSTQPTEGNYATWVAAMTRAGHGKDLPATFGQFIQNPGAAAALQAASTLGETTKDVLTQKQKAEEFQLKRKDQQMQFDQRRQDLQAQRSMIAGMHEQTMAMQRDSMRLREQQAEEASLDRKARLEETKSSNEFHQENQIITQATEVAKPTIEQYRTISSPLAAAKFGSPVLDQQLKQALPSLDSYLKGRATNMYYKDNASFGNLAQRLENNISKFATGKLSEDNRQLILQGLDFMNSQTIVDLNQQEQQLKDSAKARGLDPSKVSLPGAFPRIPSDAIGTAVTPEGKLTYAVKSPDGSLQWYSVEGGSK